MFILPLRCLSERETEKATAKEDSFSELSTYSSTAKLSVLL